jgi:hypothetical protein
MTQEFIQNLENQILTGLGGIVVTFIIAIAGYFTQKLKIQLTQSQESVFENKARQAVEYSISMLKDQIAKEGWDGPKLQADIVAFAAPYLINKFPQAVKRVGVDPKDPDAQSQVKGVLNRVFADVANTMAQSVATPDKGLTELNTSRQAAAQQTPTLIGIDAKTNAASPDGSVINAR